MKVTEKDLEKAITKIIIAEINIDLWRKVSDKAGVNIEETSIGGQDGKEKSYADALAEIRSYHNELAHLMAGAKETILDGISKATLSVLKKIDSLNIDEINSDQIQKYYALDSFANRPYIMERSQQIKLLYTKKAIPEYVKRKYREVILCCLEGRFSACCIMCRSIVEMLLKNLCAEAFKQKEYFKRESLIDMIDMCRKFKILETKELELAEKIRKMGNKSSHSEELSTEQEALDSISVLQQFLQERFG